MCCLKGLPFSLGLGDKSVRNNIGHAILGSYRVCAPTLVGDHLSCDSLSYDPTLGCFNSDLVFPGRSKNEVV
jgi:hypothetical protein